MAARTVTPTLSVAIGGVTIGGAEPVLTYEGSFAVQLTVPANSTNFEITFPHDVAGAVIQGIKTNKNCTVKTNSTSVPDQTLTMLANKGRVWWDGHPSANKVFTTDLTKLYVTTGSEETDIVVGVAEDVTP